VVDNGSEDSTKTIAEEQWAIVVEEHKKWVKHARRTGIQEANNYFKSQIILQLDSDSIPGKYWIEEHLKEYKDKNTVLVWGWLEWTWRNIDATIVINTIDFLKGRVFTICGRKKDHFEKRRFWIRKWIIPAPWTNMSYRTHIWMHKDTFLEWRSNLWEDYFRATKTVEIAKNENEENSYILKDNKEIRVKTEARWDHTCIWYLYTKYKYYRSNMWKTIQTGISQTRQCIKDIRK
jgi:cellulose synthase/poly-beta-1,6-N-acetylglucosamine synthase-like glycosyltransferase